MRTVIKRGNGKHIITDTGLRGARVFRANGYQFIGDYLGKDSNGLRMIRKPNGKVCHLRPEVKADEVLEIIENEDGRREYVIAGGIQ